MPHTYTKLMNEVEQKKFEVETLETKLAEQFSEIERLNFVIRVNKSSYRERVEEIERLLKICLDAGSVDEAEQIVDSLTEQNSAFNDALVKCEKEITRLQLDGARLDWLDGRGSVSPGGVSWPEIFRRDRGVTLREAIDAAREET